MNSVILKFIIGCVIFVTAIIVAIVEHHPDNKKEKILFVGAIIVAITTFVLLFLIMTFRLPTLTEKQIIRLSFCQLMNQWILSIGFLQMENLVMNG